MAEQEQKYASEQKSDASWNVTTTRMLIQFYKDNRILWDKKHKDYGKKQLQKKVLMPLVAKLERSNFPKGEDEIKKRWHNIRTSALRYFKKYNSDDSVEIKWAYWDDMTFLREHLEVEAEEPDPWSTEETEMLISFFQQNECLWNHNNPSYHENTHNKDILYDVLVKELNDKFNSEQVQKKWKEIEKKFKEEHSKASVRPSGSGTDEIYKPTFVFYDQLQFLTVICEGDETLDSIECQPDLNPRKKTKIQMQEERENRKLELFSQAVAAIREVPDLKKKAGNRSMEEDTEAVAFGTYVGITLSKLPRRKFRQAKKCIGDILYNIEESEDYTSSSNTSVHDNQFDRHSFVSTPNSFESSNSFTPLQNLTNERCGNNYHPAYQYQHSSSYN